MDDIQHLKSHAVEESYLFLVDSRNRDTTVWPSASEYEVAFSHPFRNVFSLDIMDAVVPRTENSVETSTNLLVCRVNDQQYRIQIQPGDYNILQLVEKLNEALAAAEAQLVVRPATTASEVANKLDFISPHPFSLDMEQSTMRYILGFGDPQRSPETNVLGRIFESSAATGGSEDTQVYDGPFPTLEHEIITATHSLRQRFVPISTGIVTRIGIYCTGSGLLHVRIVSDSSETIAEGTLDVIDSPYDPTYVTLDESETQVEAGATYYLEVSTTSSDIIKVFRAENIVDGDERRSLNDLESNNGTLWTPLAQTAQDMCGEVHVSIADYRITSPGVVDLTGERYMLVRIPEIEQHIYRDRAFEKHHGGIGMVKLGGFGYRESRMDFVSFAPPSFHPIGKLSKMTVRLTKGNGDLYETKGVDHMLLFVIKWYRAAGSTEIPQSGSLNPKYQPDMRHFMVR